MKVITRSVLAVMLALTLCGGIVNAKVVVKDGIYLDAEFRPRLEFDNRDFYADTGYDSYGTVRTRLGVGLDDLIKDTELYLMIGDSRMMGFSNPYLTGAPVGPNRYDNNLGVMKAYVLVKNIIGDGYYLKVGRMSNDQGRARIFGPGNWNFYGPRTYDGIKAGYDNDMLSVNLWNFFGVNGDRHWYPDEDNPARVPNSNLNYKRDHTLTGLDASFWEKRINLLLFLDLDQQPVADTLHGGSNTALSRYTAAVYAHSKRTKASKYWAELDLAYQFGTMAYAAGEADISAYLLAGDLGLQIDSRTKSWVGLGFHLLSGDDVNDPDEVNYFYDKYCSKHRVFGYMDYFKSDTGIKALGLQDYVIRAGVNPSKNILCAVDVHHFTVVKDFSSVVDGSSANTLGQEIDATFKYAVRKGLTAQMGLDFFLPAEDWQGPGAEMSNFFYMVLTAKL